MISLICMSTHKATASRCLSDHQAAYRQPAIPALATAPLRRLTLSVLFTIVTNSYQTTCTISERTFNKRQHANARYGVDFLLFTHYNTYNKLLNLWKIPSSTEITILVNYHSYDHLRYLQFLHESILT